MNADKAAIDYDPWRDYQRWLAAGNCTVVVPFAEKLACLIPPRSVRLRRDFAQVLLAIKAHALLHRRHRQIDVRGQIVANIDQDYRTVAELMGSIVAEASGAGIEKEVQETIDAVTSATASLASDEGATADKIAKLLRLDRSSAWRRLNKAMFKGFIVNLETRRGQPGRYRVTNQEVEVEELLPSQKALVDPPETHATVQPVIQVTENKDENGCAAGCNPHATAHATTNPMTDIEKVTSVARLHGLQGGIREGGADAVDEFEERNSRSATCAQCGRLGPLVEASDGTHTARLHHECVDVWAGLAIPSGLRRSRASSSTGEQRGAEGRT
jgi:predicted transcriptional regulator